MTLSDLLKPRYRRRDPAARRAAVRSLADEATLVELACHDPDLEVRLLAVDRIAATAGLRQVALDGEHLDARLKAARRITDPEVLAEIMRRRKNPDLMMACFEGIRDPEVLAAIARDPRQSLTARRIAINMFADQELLLQVLHTVREPVLRKAALERVTDPELRRSLQASVAGHARAGRIDRILARHDPRTVVEMLGVFRDSIGAVRALGTLAAMGGEAGERAVAILVRELRHARPAIRLAALEQLARAGTLAEDVRTELAEADPDPRVREAAARLAPGAETTHREA